MKTQFVETLQEGDVVNDYYVATRKDLRSQQNGGKFLGMVFKDRTGEIGGIMWNNAESVAKVFEVGDVVNVQGTISSYQGRLQIRTNQVLPLRDGEYDQADLVYVPENTKDVVKNLSAVLEKIENKWIKKLVDSFLADEEFMARFSTAAAGKKWHHAYSGGLAQHCYELMRIAETMCELFDAIDKDILMAGILLHDMGKLDEMSQELFVDYTDEGKLLGHVAMGFSHVDRKLAEIEGFPQNLRLQLLHCILAHHGELENGSPVVPKTLEAIVLYLMDNLDAQADAFTRVMAETKEKGQKWSEYLPLIARPIWTRE